ncbi:tetratricopeptide repeat protein [Pricia sp. S334]|uniref:Tetratricopeptide repeat protein n=1 Tax=Pricia mediterranea TaxID=3076079 RepID=A0ABU3L7W9_9FLAO|nr:tetratricopeptide repeat protein [Pricia sp. S334]MDT7829411.1 tetratricopeptide repeat protein [Pricia sp. S334]
MKQMVFACLMSTDIANRYLDLQKLVFLFLCTLLSGHEVSAQPDNGVMADSLYATGNYTKAINVYAEEGSVAAALQIARAYSAIGHYEKAIVQYRSVVDREPDAQVAAFELGKLLLRTNKYEEARKRFAHLVESDRDNPEYHYYLGEAFRELDQPASSLVSFKEAIEIDSTHLRSLFRLGKYFTIQQERDQALQYVDAGLWFYEQDVSFINLKALILFNDNQYEKAIPWFEQVLELGETQPYVYEKLAFCYYKSWEFERAKETYRTLIALDDSNSDAYFGLGETYRRNKQPDSAEIYIKKAMDVQRPVFAEGYSALAGLARDRNDLKSALEYYKMAHKETPSDQMIYFNICTLADQLYKDPKTKLKYYESFIMQFGKTSPYTSKIATRRIEELREAIHFRDN